MLSYLFPERDPELQFSSTCLEFERLPHQVNCILNNSLICKNILLIVNLPRYGNPSDWIQFCGRCSKWVEEGKRLHKLIQQLQDKLLGIKLNFLESVQRTNGDNLDVDNSTENEVLLMVRTEILRKQEIRQEEEQKDKTDGKTNYLVYSLMVL